MLMIFDSTGAMYMVTASLPNDSITEENGYTIVEVDPNEINHTHSYSYEDGSIVDHGPYVLDAAEETRRQNEINSVAYKEKRKQEYPSLEEQLDYIYHNGIDAWKTNIIDPIKSKYPKPDSNE